MTSALSQDRPLLLVGCGNMGVALLQGWLTAGVVANAVHIIEPANPERAQAAGALPSQLYRAPPECLPVPRVVLLAVKPQMMNDVLPGLCRFLADDTLIISIAAGTTLERLSTLAGGHSRIIRAMPNTPAAVGRGATVMVSDSGVTADDHALAASLLSAVGNVYTAEREEQIDAVTALSGSGPAYVFHMIECMAAAGESLGLSPALALALARDTVAGAGELACRSGEDPAVLRKQVTSPGGTTAAGLNILMGEQGLAPLILATLTAAADRSRELGQKT